MKIEQSQPNPLHSSAASSSQAAREAQGSPALSRQQNEPGVAPADRGSVSSTAGAISSALQEAGSERTARIARLTAEFQAGTYQPDPSKISDALISEGLTKDA